MQDASSPSHIGPSSDIPPWAETGTTHSADELKMGFWLAVICFIFIGAGAAASVAMGTQTSTPTLALGDVSEAQIVEIRDADGTPVLYGEFRSSVDAIGNVEKDAALMDRHGRTVIGEVELEIPAPGREGRGPELEVDIIGLPPRAEFAVVIDDRVVARFTTDDRGSIDRELQEGEAVRQ